MAEFRIDGRMKVKKLKEDFFNEFGGVLRVYNGKSKADDDASLASIRSNDVAKGGDLICRGNRTVKSFKQEMWDVFGIKVQVATKDDWIIVLDGITLSRIKDIPNYASKESMQEFVGNLTRKTKNVGDVARSPLNESQPLNTNNMALNIQGKGAEESMQLCEQIKQEMKTRNLERFIFGESGFLGEKLTEELEERSNVKWADEDQNEDLLDSVFTVRFFCTSSDVSDRSGYIWGISLVDSELRFLVIKGEEDDNGTSYDDYTEDLNLVEIYAKYSQYSGFDLESVLNGYLDVIKGNDWVEK